MRHSASMSVTKISSDSPQQTHYAIMTSLLRQKQRHFDVITSKWRRFGAITTFLLRHVFRGTLPTRPLSPKLRLHSTLQFRILNTLLFSSYDYIRHYNCHVQQEFQVLPFLKIYLNQCPNLEHSAFSSYDYIRHFNCHVQQEFQVLHFLKIYLNQCPNLEHSAFPSEDYIHHYNCQLQQEFQVLHF